MTRVRPIVAFALLLACSDDPSEGDPDGSAAPDDSSPSDDAGATDASTVDAFAAGAFVADASTSDAGRSGPPLGVVIGSSTAAGKNLDSAMYGGRVGGLDDRYSVSYQAYLSSRWAGSVVTKVARSGASTFEPDRRPSSTRWSRASMRPGGPGAPNGSAGAAGWATRCFSACPPNGLRADERTGA